MLSHIGVIGDRSLQAIWKTVRLAVASGPLRRDIRPEGLLCGGWQRNLYCLLVVGTSIGNMLRWGLFSLCTRGFFLLYFLPRRKQVCGNREIRNELSLCPFTVIFFLAESRRMYWPHLGGSQVQSFLFGDLSRGLTIPLVLPSLPAPWRATTWTTPCRARASTPMRTGAFCRAPTWTESSMGRRRSTTRTGDWSSRGNIRITFGMECAGSTTQ